MKSLQNKIFLLFVLLLITVQAIAFWTLYSGNKNQEAAEINNRLTTAKTIFTELFDRRLDYLAAFAETAAKDYGLKEVFNDDTRSLLVALNNVQYTFACLPVSDARDWQQQSVYQAL